jgi:anaerobic magnesium-protoporphyrin IX monomethyl ester cyclase
VKKSKKKILLIYTELGFVGTYLVQAPISLVYISTKLVHNPEVEIEILDCRVESNWRKKLRKIVLEDDLLMVGFFVMTGLQVGKAHEVTKFIKGLKQEVPVIWGGPHPTILPEETLDYGGIDFCVRGFGVEAFTEFAEKMLRGKKDFETIPNFCFKKDGENIIGTVNDTFERVNYKDLPYHLLDSLIERYFVGQKNRSFPIYTAFGCPYKCNFCISPIWFKDTKKKWDPLPAEEVVDHIEYLVEKYNIDFIYFWDDDTFVVPGHFSGIAEELIKRNVKVELGIRGIRSNEVNRMKTKDLDLMEKVGVNYVHIGVESGSQRMLDAMDKGITVEQSLEANRKLAEYKAITPMYNLLVGMPTETMEDLRKTGSFMLQLHEENPLAIMHPPNKLKPYPGGKSYSEAIKKGYEPPITPEDWVLTDQEVGETYYPWYTAESNRYMNMLYVAAYALSNWEHFLKQRPQGLQMFYIVAKTIYQPIAKFRLKHHVTRFFTIEYILFKLAFRILCKLAPLKSD